MNPRMMALRMMAAGPGMDEEEYKRMLRNSYGRRYNRRTSADVRMFGPRGGAPLFGRGPRVLTWVTRPVPMSFDPVSGETTFGQRF